MNVSGDRYLDDPDLVQPYVIVPIEFPSDDPMGGTMQMNVVLLSLLDERVIEVYSPHYAARCLTYERALTTTFARLARAGEQVDAVIAFIAGVPREDVQSLFTEFDDDFITDIIENGLPEGVSATAVYAYREIEALFSMSKKFVDLDLVVITDPSSNLGQAFEQQYPSGVAEFENWLGDTTTIAGVSQDSSRGIEASVVRLELDDTGALVPRVTARDIIPFDCNHEEDASLRVAMDSFKADVEASLDDETLGHAGYISSTISGTWLEEGECTSAPESSKLSGACGCAIASCPAGNLVADALQWYGKADLAFVAARSSQRSLARAVSSTGFSLA